MNLVGKKVNMVMGRKSLDIIIAFKKSHVFIRNNELRLIVKNAFNCFICVNCFRLA
jgi:hypothetical protein